MNADDDSPPQVTVYWRPGCGFCHLLRRQLDRAGVERNEVNIWADAEAAALVRSVARGNETVPTVVVGTRALVNPSAREVLALLGGGGRGQSLPRSGRSRLPLAGAGWSFATAAGWLALALTNPGTTYHLAPLLTALAWPLAVARSPRRSPRVSPGLLAVAGSAALAAAVLGVLVLAGALDGPALIGSSARAESLVMISVGTTIGLVLLGQRAGSVQDSDNAAASTSSTLG